MQNREMMRPTYFELQAYVGTTKHMGGMHSTKELIALCHIGEGQRVLDVGCGVGPTACYLVSRHGCRVTGVDLSEAMVAQTRQRSRREGVQDKVEFRVADARSLCLADSALDVAICESVITFIEQKAKGLSECVRVTQPGGFVGLNEEVWIAAPAPTSLAEYVQRTWDIHSEIRTPQDWRKLMADCGLTEVVVRPYRFNAARESSQVGRYHLGELARMFSRLLSLYLRSSEFRRYIRDRHFQPKKLFEYLG